MQRKVELFIRKGNVIKPAEPGSGPDHYGQIEISGFPESPDPRKEIVYTHIRHSFTDPNNQPTQGSVYFFLIPMEYLFAEDDVPPNENETPMLAVNITTKFPYLRWQPKEQNKPNPNNKLNRHPCTTKLSICGDSFATNPTQELCMSLFLINFLSIKYFFKHLFHRDRRYLYGINDYGELTIIEVTQNELDGNNNIAPWSKIVLKPKLFPKNEHFGRTYSPKMKKRGNIEFKILVQRFGEIDDWKWDFN